MPRITERVARKLERVQSIAKDPDRKPFSEIVRDLRTLRSAGEPPQFYLERMLYRNQSGDVDEYITGKDAKGMYSVKEKGPGWLRNFDDKLLFDQLMRPSGLPLPTFFGSTRMGAFVSPSGEVRSLSDAGRMADEVSRLVDASDTGAVFAKPIVANKGSGAFRVTAETLGTKADALFKAISSNDYLFQESVRQHEGMSASPVFPSLEEAVRLAREARAYLYSLRPPAPGGVRTLIFAQGRTGSTVLESLVGSTGHFVKNGEVLKDKSLRVLRPTAYVKGLSREPKRLGPGGHFICHVKINHLRGMRSQAGRRPVDPAQFLRALADDGWRAVYLRREDRVRHALSHFVSQASGLYHSHGEPAPFTIRVDRDDLEQFIQDRLRHEAGEQAALAESAIDVHNVTYERDLLDSSRHQDTVDQIMDFLSLSRRPVQTTMRKVVARPMSETVENYDEFAEWVGELSPSTQLD